MKLGKPLYKIYSAEITPTPNHQHSSLKHLITRYLAEPEASAARRLLCAARRVVTAIANTTIGDALTLTTRMAIVLVPLVWVIASKQ